MGTFVCRLSNACRDFEAASSGFASWRSGAQEINAAGDSPEYNRGRGVGAGQEERAARGCGRPLS
jgi:hypothetical protein